jgi:hypothetical protein
MPGDTEDDVEVVAAEIGAYLRVHPDAADTVEGVARWWLRRPPSREAIERAMALLLNRRIVERLTLPDGTVIFRGRLEPPSRP